MKIKVCVPRSAVEPFNVEISGELFLENLKGLCAQKFSFSPTEILVYIHRGCPLMNDKISLQDLGIKDGDTVSVERSQVDVLAAAAAVPQERSNNVGYEFALPLPVPLPLPHPHPQKSSTLTPAEVLQLDFSGIQVPNMSCEQPQASHVSRKRKFCLESESDPEKLIDIFLKDPKEMAMLQNEYPSIAQALKRGDFETFSRLAGEVRSNLRTKDEEEKQQLMKRVRLGSAADADALEIEAQRRIEDEIMQNNVDDNYESALEYHPESFGSDLMLYINCKVNGQSMKAFVDTGAQVTIMSSQCAERCGLMRLVDKRFHGMAVGVGTKAIIGKIHACHIQIDNDFFTISINILQDDHMDFILGLDILKRHQCVVDLNRGLLKIGTTGAETPFLPESQIPKRARLTPSEATRAEEEAVLSQGGEDASLARGLEDSLQNSESLPGSGSVTRSHTSAKQLEDDLAVQDIAKLGFTREQAVLELRRFNGDKVQAIAALFAKSLKFK